ncbi:hypothetical protein GQ457_09G022170 [Hibiscus cannabinus]
MDIRQNTIWSKVWNLKVSQRIRVFAWLVLHGRLLTNVERVRRHCAASELCEVCHGGPENIEHIIPSKSQAVFYTIPIHEWLTGNMFGTPCDISNENWSIRFIILCWMIWKRRCSFVLASEVRRMEDILTSGDMLVEECRRAFYGQAAPSVTPTSANSWSCPPVDWVKINVDATVSTLDCTATIGAVFRDCEGNWLCGIARSIGRCNVLLAELWAIHDGLLHAWSRGFRRIEIESDNLEVVRIVTSISTALGDSGLVLSIKRCCAKIGEFKYNMLVMEIIEWRIGWLLKVVGYRMNLLFS